MSGIYDMTNCTMKINYLDLFSGVGGFTRGLLDAGFTFGWHGYSEIDKHAVKLYQGLYPTAVSSPVVQCIAERLRQVEG